MDGTGAAATHHLEWMGMMGARPGTVAQRRCTLGRLRRWTGSTRWADLSAGEVVRFVARPGRGADARAAEVSHLRVFWRWSIRHGWTDRDPTVLLDRPHRPRRLPRPIPDELLALAFTEVPPRMAHWLALAAFAGLRCCEIAPLHGRDWDRGAGVLVIRAAKGGDAQAVPVSAALGEMLERLPRDGWWCPRWDGAPGALSAGQLQRHANRWLAGVAPGWTMHTLRHWCGTAIYRATRDLRVTQEALRHRSIISTVGYTAVTPGAVAAAFAAVTSTLRSRGRL